MRLRHLRIFAFLGLAAALTTACGLQEPAATPTPTTPALVGQVDITAPGSGAVIYAEALHIAGTARQLPEAGFRLVVTTALDEQIAAVTVQPDSETWSVEIVHDYTGDPVEITIAALPMNPQVPGDYDIAAAVLSSIENRPEGTYGMITMPLERTQLGGDQVLISGIASGLPEDTLRVTLESEDGVIDEQTVERDHPYPLDELPWEAELLTNGYTGPATVSATYIDPETDEEITLDSVPVEIGTAAG